MFARACTALALIAVGTVFALTVPAATIGPLSGGGFVIPDGDPSGASSAINNPTGGTISDVTVSIDFGSTFGAGLGHTWIGDLTATLSFGGFSVDLFSIVDTIPASGFGDDSNLLGLYAFNDAFTGSLTDAAQAAGGDDTVPPGNYSPTTAGNVGTSLLASFKDLDAAGLWTLSIIDGVAGDTGGIAGWNLTLATQDAPTPPVDGDPTSPSTVPEPGAGMLFALGLFALGAAGRRRLG